MKRISFFAGLFLALAAILLACNKGTPTVVTAQSVPRYWNQTTYDTDTLTNADTITIDLGTFNAPVYYEVQIAADSLSGGTAGNAYLQHNASASGSDWTTLSTTVIDGLTVRSRVTGNILGGRLRLYTISSGTQSTALRVARISAGKPD